ncbi:MAG: GTP 3',8-cyclase MoaA [Myxococcales bacterium]|nr:GTP 3',8-cyclase MoaA [Myxococcales bacterium]
MSLVQIRPRTSSQESEHRALTSAPLVDPQERRVRYLRVSLTDRCNYRCTYCMPEEGIEHRAREEVLSLEEVVTLCAAFARWGVERVRLTGGEPTVRKGVVELVASLRQIETPKGALEVVMTTNGERLESLAEPLMRAGLSGLTVSVDSLRPARFREITRRGNLPRVLAGIERARAVGFRAIKLNTVAIRGFNDDELGEITEYAWSRDIVPRFIELMPMAGGRLFVPGELMPAQDIRAAIATATDARVGADAGEGVAGLGPASYWRVASGRFAGRRFGVIAAMTENFCGSCNRLRISAAGQLHACLARDEAGDLRAALRAGDPGALEDRVRAILGAKRDRHAFALDGTGGPRKAMISIGG